MEKGDSMKDGKRKGGRTDEQASEYGIIMVKRLTKQSGFLAWKNEHFDIGMARAG